jgi:ribosomal 30S subunit maturation factor RimM
MKNLDGKAYQNKEELDAEKLELLAKKSRLQQLEDGTYHPHDLMAHKIREHVEKENRKSLAFLD